MLNLINHLILTIYLLYLQIPADPRYRYVYKSLLYSYPHDPIALLTWPSRCFPYGNSMQMYDGAYGS